jgi:hypothetical protein
MTMIVVHFYCFWAGSVVHVRLVLLSGAFVQIFSSSPREQELVHLIV